MAARLRVKLGNSNTDGSPDRALAQVQINQTIFVCTKKYIEERVAAIAPWFHLRLPSCSSRFKSQADHLCFFNLYD